MIITYSEFCELVSRFIKSGDDFYDALLENVIKNPLRYCGLFRLSNSKMKMIQNVTQSMEIKFGDIIEEMTTMYLERLGFTNFDKKLNIGNNKYLKLDQYFTDDQSIYMVEMKIRDDHDSSKKKGQFDNFESKLQVVKSRNPDKTIKACMWFVDDGLQKNKAYYLERIQGLDYPNCAANLYYGGEFFATLKNGNEAWNQLKDILSQHREENDDHAVEIPDFGNSREILDALIRLPSTNWNKLMSDEPQFVMLRKELFSSGLNLETAKQLRIHRLSNK